MKSAQKKPLITILRQIHTLSSGFLLTGTGSIVFYGVNFTAEAKDLSSVKAKSPEGQNYSLSKETDNSFYYNTDTNSEDNSSFIDNYEDLSFGTYTFTMEFTDKTEKKIQNILSREQKEISSPPQFAGISSEATSLNISFKKAGFADYYNIYLLDKTKEKILYKCLEAPEENLQDPDADVEAPLTFTIEKGIDISDAEKDSGCSSDSGWSKDASINSDSTVYFSVSAYRYVRIESSEDSEEEQDTEIDKNDLQMIFPMKTPIEIDKLHLENW